MIRWFKSFLPFSLDARASLMYLSFAGGGPAVLIALMINMDTIRNWTGAPAGERLERYADIADKLAWGLLIVLVTLACFISIRAFKFNAKTGTLDIDGNSAGQGAQIVADAAQETADTIKPSEPVPTVTQEAGA